MQECTSRPHRSYACSSSSVHLFEYMEGITLSPSQSNPFGEEKLAPRLPMLDFEFKRYICGIQLLILVVLAQMKVYPGLIFFPWYQYQDTTIFSFPLIHMTCPEVRGGLVQWSVMWDSACIPPGCSLSRRGFVCTQALVALCGVCGTSSQCQHMDWTGNIELYIW